MAELLSYVLAGQNPGQYYRHSGRTTLHGPLVALLVGLPAALVLGVIYAYADRYIPIAILNLLLSVGFGAVMGGLCGLVLRWGKVRNLPVALTIIGLLALASYYISWVAWEYLVIEGGKMGLNSIRLAFAPRLVWLLAQAINDQGTWSLGHGFSSGGPNVTGVVLWAAWLGEAAAVFGGAFVVGRKMIADRPFCERCHRWCEKKSTLARLHPGDVSVAKPQMERGDYTFLTALATTTTPNPTWWELLHHYCKGCNDLQLVRLVQKVRRLDKKGNERIKETVVVPTLIVSTQQVQQMRQAIAVGIAQAAQPPAAAPAP